MPQMQSRNHHRLRRMQKHDLELRTLTVNDRGHGFPPLEKQIPLRQQVAPPDQQRQQVAPQNQRTQLVQLRMELSLQQHRHACRKAWMRAPKLELVMNLDGRHSTWGTRYGYCTALTRKSYGDNFGDFMCVSGTHQQPGFASC